MSMPSLYDDIFPQRKNQPSRENQTLPARELYLCRRSADLAAGVFREASRWIKPGVSRMQLARQVLDWLKKRGGEAQIIISISPGSTAWHGKIDHSPLREGEPLTLDIARREGGVWYDSAVSYPVGDVKESTHHLLQGAREAFQAVVKILRSGIPAHRICQAVERVTEKFQLTLIAQGMGHGVGRQLHERPFIPYSAPLLNEAILPGRLVTVEPVLTEGTGELQLQRDGSALTRDGRYTAYFEATLLASPGGTEVFGMDDFFAEIPC